MNDKSKNNKQTKIDFPPPLPPNEDWRTLDIEVLYDTDKCDLNRCKLESVYKILE